jgi:hypothetical protein
MTLQELKQQIIVELGEMYPITFDQDIDECNDAWSIITVLNEYGYDTQGSLSILFSILIK